MELVLIEEVPNLGTIGDLVRVKPGYGRNYLLPKGLAVVASPKQKRKLEHDKRIAAHKLEKAKAAAQDVATRLGNMTLNIARKVGEQDKLYGSVTAMDIEAALDAQGMKVDRRKIALDEPIKTLGVFQVPIKLYSDLATEVQVMVVAE